MTYKNDYGNSMSTCTWSGQRQVTEGDKPTLITTWLLTSQTKPDSNWKSTDINKDTFLRPPSKEVVGEPCGQPNKATSC